MSAFLLLGLTAGILLIAFVVFAWRKGMKVRPPRSREDHHHPIWGRPDSRRGMAGNRAKPEAAHHKPMPPL
jgi:hypothetical protein